MANRLNVMLQAVITNAIILQRYVYLLIPQTYFFILCHFHIYILFFCRFTASAQNSPCVSTEEKRVCLSASRSTRLRRMRAENTQNTSTLPPARSKSSRWGGGLNKNKGKKKLDALKHKHAVLVSVSVVHDHPHDLFQPKGADRKQKTDREKMEKRAPQEKEKYQPSYETTILTEVSTLL